MTRKSWETFENWRKKEEKRKRIEDKDWYLVVIKIGENKTTHLDTFTLVSQQKSDFIRSISFTNQTFSIRPMFLSFFHFSFLKTHKPPTSSYFILQRMHTRYMLTLKRVMLSTSIMYNQKTLKNRTKHKPKSLLCICVYRVYMIYWTNTLIMRSILVQVQRAIT